MLKVLTHCQLEQKRHQVTSLVREIWVIVLCGPHYLILSNYTSIPLVCYLLLYSSAVERAAALTVIDQCSMTTGQHEVCQHPVSTLPVPCWQLMSSFRSKTEIWSVPPRHSAAWPLPSENHTVRAECSELAWTVLDLLGNLNSFISCHIFICCHIYIILNS